MFESSTLLASLRRSWSQIVAMLPDLALALLLLIAGWLVAKLLRRAAIRVLRAIHVDELAEKAGIDDFLVRGGVPVTTVTLLGNTLYWLVLAGVFMTLLEALGLKSAGAPAEPVGALARYTRKSPRMIVDCHTHVNHHEDENVEALPGLTAGGFSGRLEALIGQQIKEMLL